MKKAVFIAIVAVVALAMSAAATAVPVVNAWTATKAERMLTRDATVQVAASFDSARMMTAISDWLTATLTVYPEAQRAPMQKMFDSVKSASGAKGEAMPALLKAQSRRP